MYFRMSKFKYPYYFRSNEHLFAQFWFLVLFETEEIITMFWIDYTLEIIQAE